MSDHVLEHLKNQSAYRFMAEGVPFADWMKIREQVTSLSAWCPTWETFGAEAETRANEAIQAGNTATAATEFSRAALYYCFGQYLLWHDPATKERTYFKAVNAWRRASEFLSPPQT